VPVPPGSDRGKEYWTPPRARLFSQAIQLSDFPAKVMKVLEPALADCESVLDVGAGVGSLTVPLAKSVQQVTALEPSPAMLGELRANLSRNRLQNVNCLQAAWGEIEITLHDLVLVANVAPIFEDLLGFLTAAEPLARRAVALIQNVGPGAEKFYLGELYPLLLGRSYPPRDDYLRTLMLLHSLGIYANVQIIAYRFDQPFATLEEAADFWTGQMRLTEPEQRGRLLAFLHARLERVGEHLIAPMRRQSAVIWWQVTPREPA
jgi:SAM-dependent methyltransferase